MERDSQNDKILKYLCEVGPLTPAMARRKFKCKHLASRIYELRLMGIVIKTSTVRYRGKAIASYSV